jgi:hypothetical protein
MSAVASIDRARARRQESAPRKARRPKPPVNDRSKRPCDVLPKPEWPTAGQAGASGTRDREWTRALCASVEAAMSYDPRTRWVRPRLSTGDRRLAIAGWAFVALAALGGLVAAAAR